MDFYDRVFGKTDYRILALLPPLLGLLLIPLAMNIPLGIDFVGGTEVQIVAERALSESAVSGAVAACVSDAHISIQDLGGKTTILVKTKEDLTKACLDESFSSNLGFTDEELKKVIPSTFKPELGRTLLDQGINVFMIAVILMVIVVFLAFRTVIPSIAVISAALFDIIIALGLLSLFGIELTLAGVAALLMLVGYSVDTDIMLTTRTLKQANKPFDQSVNEAFVTGITMTGTTLAAMTSIIVVTSFLEMEAMAQIAYVLVAGLVADLFTTWFMNVGILKWYTGRKGGLAPSRFKFSLFRD